MLPENAYTQFTRDMKINRLVNGMWQVSGAHGRIDPDAALDAMMKYHEAGFSTWDLADHYGPAEDFIGKFRERLGKERGKEALEKMHAFTKWVPSPGPMPRKVVEKAIDNSLRRMQVPALDLMQFHWWDYNDGSYIEALYHMEDLRDEGKIKHLALTNFDTTRVEKILDNGIEIVSNQVQYSVVDRRPEKAMIPLCAKYGVKIFAYGTLLGGFLSEKYLGQPEPDYYTLQTASLRKYKGMIDAWGEWSLFQDLLNIMDSIGKKHGVGLSNVATKYILEKAAVAGILVGARLGIRDHISDNARVFSFSLDESDFERIDRVTTKSRDIFKIIGDCGDEYRR